MENAQTATAYEVRIKIGLTCKSGKNRWLNSRRRRSVKIGFGTFMVMLIKIINRFGCEQDKGKSCIVNSKRFQIFFNNIKRKIPCPADAGRGLY